MAWGQRQGRDPWWLEIQAGVRAAVWGSGTEEGWCPVPGGRGVAVTGGFRQRVPRWCWSGSKQDAVVFPHLSDQLVLRPIPAA